MEAQGHILIRRKAKNGIDGTNGEPGKNGQCTSLYLLERFNNALKHAILRRYGRAGLF